MKLEKTWFLVEVDLSFTQEEIDVLAECSEAHYDGKCKAAATRGFINGLRNVLQDGVATWRFDPELCGLALKILEVSGYLLEHDKQVLASRLTVFLRNTQTRMNNLFYDKNTDVRRPG